MHNTDFDISDKYSGGDTLMSCFNNSGFIDGDVAPVHNLDCLNNIAQEAITDHAVSARIVPGERNNALFQEHSSQGE